MAGAELYGRLNFHFSNLPGLSKASKKIIGEAGERHRGGGGKRQEDQGILKQIGE